MYLCVMHAYSMSFVFDHNHRLLSYLFPDLRPPRSSIVHPPPEPTFLIRQLTSQMTENIQLART